MRYGTIVNYSPDKKFGFIKPDVGPDVFFYITALDPNQAQSEIEVGQIVKFELMTRVEATKSRPGHSNEKLEQSGRQVQPTAKLVEMIDKLPGATLTGGEPTSPRHQRARHKKPTWRR